MRAADTVVGSAERLGISRQVVDDAGFKRWVAAKLSVVKRDDVCDIGKAERGVPIGHGPPLCVARTRPNKSPFPCQSSTRGFPGRCVVQAGRIGTKWPKRC